MYARDKARKPLSKRLASSMAAKLQELSQVPAGSQALGAWFLGPKAENESLLRELICLAIEDHAKFRRDYFSSDPLWLTPDRKNSESYKQSVSLLKDGFNDLIRQLDGSVPFFSYRYQGHMLWDVTLPAVLGYFAAMLCNQNNVAAEASPVTTLLEMHVGDDLCRLLGYQVPERKDVEQRRGYDRPRGTDPGAWGHITCDGSVANIEALWAARNLKYYPLGFQAALRRERALAAAKGMAVKLSTGVSATLAELDVWTLLNLETDVILELPERLVHDYGIPESALDVLDRYSLQENGFLEFSRRYAAQARDLVVLTPSTRHYSWPKAGALLGLGGSNVRCVQVDLDARMDLQHLRAQLDSCLRERSPVAMVVAVAGTTEEGAVDPLHGIVKLREEYRARGLEFWIHVDAAWGGYFASILRECPGDDHAQASADEEDEDDQTWLVGPSLSLSDYVKTQYESLDQAESITIDPHKAGYVPYPAGALCYRNSAMRHLVAFTSPVVYHGGIDPTVGVYGIEGSKPGAAAAATYLSHRVIHPDASGYGRILGRCLFNSKRFYAALVTMAQPDDPFVLVPFQRTPVQRAPVPTAEKLEIERKWLQAVAAATNCELLRMLEEEVPYKDARKHFRELGSDLLIIAYAFNFLRRDGTLNEDLKSMNVLNRRIFERLSVRQPSDEVPEVPLIVTSSRFDPDAHGSRLLDDYKKRLGVHGPGPIDFLISTTMDPWLTDTESGNFIPTLITAFRDVVTQEVQRIRAETQ